MVHDDGGGQVVDAVEVGPVGAGQAGAGERGERVVELPLCFGGDGVEDEGCLAGAGDAGEDGDGVFGDLDGDVSQVVLAGAGDGDPVP
ncbi:hypothetical protein AB0H83_19745 [Dactylosporangium sp. NPDC050688]|uniref:hypothetical protein n=1 Tax=Dactylosporangium sp. NPDC050688 TaxID=3157217 RepID=UPI0034117662